MIKNLISDFSENEIAPTAAIFDENEEFNSENIAKLAKINLLGLTIPAAYGGADADTKSLSIAIEEISRVDGSCALTICAHYLALSHIFTMGTDEQRQKYVIPLAEGDMIGCWALTEPHAGSDVGAIRTTATFDGDEWILNGFKSFVTNGGIADVAVIIAKTDKNKGYRGLTAFIVECANPGFIVGKFEKKLGLRASNTTEVFLEDCRIPKENQLGERGNGFFDALKNLDGGRIGIGALAVGIAQAAFDASIKYAKEREQFGRPIGTFQAIGFMLADMATEIAAARLLVHKAADLYDQGRRITKEASMAKLFASEVAMRTATKAVQIYGGYGCIRDYPVERFMRDAKMCEIMEGTSEIQRLVLAKEFLRD